MATYQAETRIKVVECGPSRWDCDDHRLDYPDHIDTIDFKERVPATNGSNGFTVIAAPIGG